MPPPLLFLRRDAAQSTPCTPDILFWSCLCHAHSRPQDDRDDDVLFLFSRARVRHTHAYRRARGPTRRRATRHETCSLAPARALDPVRRRDYFSQDGRLLAVPGPVSLSEGAGWGRVEHTRGKQQSLPPKPAHVTGVGACFRAPFLPRARLFLRRQHPYWTCLHALVPVAE